MLNIPQLRIELRKRFNRIVKASSRIFYFIFDVHYYLQQGHCFRRSIELARATIYH